MSNWRNKPRYRKGRKFKAGEAVVVNMPDNTKLSATILRVSPDNLHCVVRLDDDVEMITETRKLGWIGTEPARYG